MRLNLIFIVTINVLIINNLNGQTKTNIETTKEAIPLVYAFQQTIYSEILGEHRTVNVSLPENFYTASAQHTYPILLYQLLFETR